MRQSAKALIAGLLLFNIGSVLAQTGVVVHQKDGSADFYSADKVDYIEFVTDYSSKPDPTPGQDANLTSVIKNLSNGMTLEATAVVTAVDNRGVVLTDNAGSILYYNDSYDVSKYPVGTVVKVKGAVSIYNRGYQLTNTATIETAGTIQYTYPQPVTYTASMITEACSAADNFQATYVTINGKVALSGNYINVVVNGTTCQGSVYYAPDNVKAGLLNGKNYDLTGYFVSVSSSSSTKFFNIVITDYKETVEETPENGVPSEYTYPLSYVKLPEGTPQQVKDYISFTVNFNKDNHTPNYVAWELLSSEVNGTVATSRNYWVDKEIEGCLSTDYAYSTYNYERGHMCPAADNKFSSEAMKACAVMTNMVPQYSSLNSGLWSKLEDKERDWALRDGAIWIVSGPVYTEDDQTYVGDALARAPSACFKALLYYNGDDSRAIGFIFQNGPNPGNIEDYAMSIDDLEAELGYDLFPALPDDIEQRIEATYSFSDWNK